MGPVINVSFSAAIVAVQQEGTMSEYIHHVSGRLRLKLAQVRKQPQRAQEVEAAICRIRGVTAVEASTVTGSVLIRYDAAEVDVGTIMNSMKEAGLAAAGAENGLMHHKSSASPLAGKVVDVLVERLIERSAVALIGALL
jgi:copper chaperone CopZ